MSAILWFLFHEIEGVVMVDLAYGTNCHSWTRAAMLQSRTSWAWLYEFPLLHLSSFHIFIAQMPQLNKNNYTSVPNKLEPSISYHQHKELTERWFERKTLHRFWYLSAQTVALLTCCNSWSYIKRGGDRNRERLGSFFITHEKLMQPKLQAYAKNYLCFHILKSLVHTKVKRELKVICAFYESFSIHVNPAAVSR